MDSTLPPYNHSKNDHYLILMDRTFKCVCQLCSCGNHKCPKQYIKGDFKTSYKQHYQNHFPPMHQQMVKDRGVTTEERHYNPEALRTSYQQTYVEPLLSTQQEGQAKVSQSSLSSPSRLEHLGRQILQSGPFIGSTSYQQQYKPFKIQQEQPSISISPRGHQAKALKFAAQSSYRSQFHTLPLPKINRYRHPNYTCSLPFTGESSYRKDYSPFKIEQNCELSPGIANNHVKFQGSSTYNSHFKGVQVKDPSEKTCRLDCLPNNKASHNLYDHFGHQLM